MASKRARQGDHAIQQYSCSTVPSCMSDMESFLSSLEPLIRRIVREELERDRSLRQFEASNQLTGISEAKPAFRLCFTNKMQQTYFTNSKILSAEDDVPVKIALFDVTSQSMVTSGPLSSLKIGICVLDAGFVTEENWTLDEFNANILIQREGKAPLLSGERSITLENGEGCITKMMFTDNSSWVRSGKFRLGARVLKPSVFEASIKEAISDSFRVKDNRGEAHKKHDVPSLNDQIWRLRKIRKDGKIHNWLSSRSIHTVKDLLRFHTINPSLFQEKYGDIPAKSWEAIMDHAMACVIDEEERYIYQTTEPPAILIFNCIYKVVGVAFDGQNYCHPDSLTFEQKHLVEKAKLHAYKNADTIIPLGETTTLNFSIPYLASLQAGPSAAAHRGQLGESFSEDKQEGGDLWPGLMEMMQYSPPSGGGFFSAEMCTEQGDGWSSSGLQVPLANSFGPCAASNGQAGTSLYFASCDGAGSSHALYSCFPNSAVSVSSKAKRNKAAWRKVRTTLKWVLSVTLKREKLRKISYC